MMHLSCVLILQAIIFEKIVRGNEPDDLPDEQLKVPSQISVTGTMTCSKTPAYAVLVSILERVEYSNNGGTGVGKLRISRYGLTGRDGTYDIFGSRYVGTDRLYLNITHHCVPLSKRKKYRNCFTTALHKIRGDPKNVRYEVETINLDERSYQGEVTCRDWPYEYPEFIRDYITKNPT